MTDAERYNVLITLWQQHALLEYLWPHDEDFERWFSMAIPGVFQNLAQWQTHAEGWQQTAELWRENAKAKQKK